MAPRALLVVVTAALLTAVCAAPSSAATVYGGGSLAASPNDPVPLFLVTVDQHRVSIVGRSGGFCTNGATGLGNFSTHRVRLRRHGRFHTKGSFVFIVPGALARGTYRIQGRVRASRGTVTGLASVQVHFPNAATGKTTTCKSGERAFRARNPASSPRGSRGPFYGVTSQGLPIVVRPTGDASSLSPVALWATLSCNVLGPMSATARLPVPATAPGVYSKTGVVSSSFIPALGSTRTIPAGTYDYTTYALEARIASGAATGAVTLSSKIGNAQKLLIDTCAAPPITFIALP